MIGHALKVLITNLPFSDTRSDEMRVCASTDDVIDLYLEEYKVEAGFRMMKSGRGIGNVHTYAGLW